MKISMLTFSEGGGGGRLLTLSAWDLKPLKLKAHYMLFHTLLRTLLILR